MIIKESTRFVRNKFPEYLSNSYTSNNWWIYQACAGKYTY